jgi:hypothetical protein
MSVAPLQFLLLVFAGWVNRRQVEILEYLREENRILSVLPPLSGRPIEAARYRRYVVTWSWPALAGALLVSNPDREHPVHG